METFSGHHMEICFINHCCPVKQKSNHRWGRALSKFLMHGNYEAGCVPTQENQTCHVPGGACARTGRNLTGKLAGGTGGCTHCSGAQHFPGTSSAHLENTVHCSGTWKTLHCSGLCPLQEPLAWGEQKGHFQSLPGSLVPAWPSLPKGKPCFTVSIDSDISPLMDM